MYQTYFIEAPLLTKFNVLELVLKLIEMSINLPIHNLKYWRKDWS